MHICCRAESTSRHAVHLVLFRSVFKGFLFLRRNSQQYVDVHIGRLRKVLSHGRERDPIRTVRSAGYSFDEFFGESWRR